MFDGLLFQKGCFKELQFSLKRMTATHFICIIKQSLDETSPWLHGLHN